jgi:hypothetical protein
LPLHDATDAKVAGDIVTNALMLPLTVNVISTINDQRKNIVRMPTRVGNLEGWKKSKAKQHRRPEGGIQVASML